ncbi:MAG TPA: cache domain-containing protein, partial [Methylomirabilota bacterium]|nr:cache domain-containing protein [Methylomirabilota bacterium]
MVVVVSVGAMSLLAVSVSRRSLRDQASAANRTAASLAARAIEQYLADAASIMREAPGRPKLSQEIRGGNWAEAAKVLDNFLRHFPQFDYVFVQDPQGVIRVRVPHTGTVGQDFSFREFFQEVVRTRALSISDVYVSQAAQRPVVSIAVPVLEGGEMIKGILVGALSLGTMSEVVSAIGKDDGAQLYLVDRKGVLIARSNGGQTEPQREDLTALPIVQAALAGKAGTMEFTDPRTREAVLGAHVPIARLGWGVVATKPTSMAFAPADRLARWLLAIAAVCAALAVVLGWRLARALTRPIARLATATDRLAAGDFSVRLSPEGRDEVASLTVSFNFMAERIQTSYQSLERKTQEVEAVNEALVGEIAERRRAQDEVSRLNQALQRRLEELQRTQAQLVQSEKVATMGSLLAGVAHELNNPLSIVAGYATMLRDLSTDEATRRRGEMIHAAAERCARIVRSFLAMARSEPRAIAPVQVNGLVEAALEMLAYGLRTADVQVERQLDPELPSVLGDADQLHQVVT